MTWTRRSFLVGLGAVAAAPSVFKLNPDMSVAQAGDTFVKGLFGPQPPSNLHVALFTTDPFTEVARETGYANYARVAVQRSAKGWTVSDGGVANNQAIMFPSCGDDHAEVDAFAIIDDDNNTLFTGSLGHKLHLSEGLEPCFASGALSIDIHDV